jgi:hypothetical protein
MDRVRERMLKECQRPSFAEVAQYKKPIGSDKSKWPTGPSIRFAEMAVRCMGNVTVENVVTFDDRERRIIHVTVTDLEANVPYSQDVTVSKTVERKFPKQGDVVLRERVNSYGDKIYLLEASDDEVQIKSAALVSKMVRTLGLRLIPGDVTDECMTAVVATQDRADKQDPDAARRKLFDSFGTVGVRVEQIKAHMGHDCATLNPRELQDLRALYAAIRDGDTTWHSVTELREAQAATGIEAVKAAAAAAAAAAARKPAAKKPTPAPTAPPPPLAAAVDPDTGEIEPGAAPAPAESAPAEIQFDETAFLRKLQACRDIDTLDVLIDELRDMPGGDARSRVMEVYQARRAAIE